MALPTNSFRSKRYFRSRFKEGKYLLAAEASDMELEIYDLTREFIKNSYGSFAVQTSWKPDQTNANTIVVRPGMAWDQGIPLVMKSASDPKVIQGIIPVAGVTYSELNATPSDVGGKQFVFDAALADDTYAIIVEAIEELVRPIGTGTVDTFLQGINVNEETENKLRLIQKLHVILNSDLTETPTYPLSVANHFVNKIVVTPQTGTANFKISATQITQDVNGADIRLTLDNANGNLPFSTDAADFINGIFVDSDGNEMTITSITTEDAGATVKILLDREVDYNSSAPKASLPVITNLVPYQLIKRDYYVSSNTGTPLGRHFYKVAQFVTTTGVVTSLTDSRVVSGINTFGYDSNVRLTGGGLINFNSGTGDLIFAGNLFVTVPDLAGRAAILPTTVNFASDGDVAFFFLDRTATVDYNPTLTVVSKVNLPTSVDVYVVMERQDNRIHFPHNGSVGNGDTNYLGGFGQTAGLSDILTPIGTIIPFYDFNGALTFNPTNWAYCDGSVKTVGSIGAQTLPDLSNRYLVGFGNEGAGDIGTDPWSSLAIGNPSHIVNLSHVHSMNGHVHNMHSHTHYMQDHVHKAGATMLAMITFNDPTVSVGRLYQQRVGTTGWTPTFPYGGLSGVGGADGVTPATGTKIIGQTAGPFAQPNTDVPSTPNTLAPNVPDTLGEAPSLASQDVKPRSIRVRFIMRIL